LPTGAEVKKMDCAPEAASVYGARPRTRPAGSVAPPYVNVGFGQYPPATYDVPEPVKRYRPPPADASPAHNTPAESNAMDTRAYVVVTTCTGDVV